MGGAQIAEIDGAAWNVSLERSGRRRCHLAGEPGAARPDGDAAERLGTHPLRRRLGRGAARQRCDGPLRPFRSADQSAPVLARIPLHLAAGFVPAAAPAATVRLLLPSPLHPPRVVKGRHRCNPLRSTAKVAAPVPVAKHQKFNEQPPHSSLYGLRANRLAVERLAILGGNRENMSHGVAGLGFHFPIGRAAPHL